MLRWVGAEITHWVGSSSWASTWAPVPRGALGLCCDGDESSEEHLTGSQLNVSSRREAGRAHTKGEKLLLHVSATLSPVSHSLQSPSVPKTSPLTKKLPTFPKSEGRTTGIHLIFQPHWCLFHAISSITLTCGSLLQKIIFRNNTVIYFILMCLFTGND